MNDFLIAYCQSNRVGIIERDKQKDNLTFRYDPKWRANRASYPISLSMPLAIEIHRHEKIEPYLWGLLSDNPTTLDMYGKRFGVSPRNAFKLLSHVGEDCAGAIQFVKPDKESAWIDQQSETVDDVKWIDEESLINRIELLVNDHSATRLATDNGYFSLAGAQPKTALFFDQTTSRWGVPKGRTPSTHILKPATGDFDGFAENEHFCLCLARRLGLKTAKTEVKMIGEHPVIIVERFDRVKGKKSGQIIRIHQ